MDTQVAKTVILLSQCCELGLSVTDLSLLLFFLRRIVQVGKSLKRNLLLWSWQTKHTLIKSISILQAAVYQPASNFTVFFIKECMFLHFICSKDYSSKMIYKLFFIYFQKPWAHLIYNEENYNCVMGTTLNFSNSAFAVWQPHHVHLPTRFLKISKHHLLSIAPEGRRTSVFQELCWTWPTLKPIQFRHLLLFNFILLSSTSFVVLPCLQ